MNVQGSISAPGRWALLTWERPKNGWGFINIISQMGWGCDPHPGMELPSSSAISRAQFCRDWDSPVNPGILSPAHRPGREEPCLLQGWIPFPGTIKALIWGPFLGHQHQAVTVVLLNQKQPLPAHSCSEFSSSMHYVCCWSCQRS